MSVVARVSPEEPGRPHGPWSFTVTYAALCAVLFGAYFWFAFPYSGWPYGLFTRYLHGYAVAAGATLRLFEPAIAVSGNDIVGRAGLAIVRGCDGTDVLILFSAAVMASRWRPWRLRAAGVVAGTAALSLANAGRICCLYGVAVSFPSTFEFWHLELWPLLLIVLAVGLFVGWSRWSAPKVGKVA